MNCDQANTEIIAYLKDELSAEKKERLEEHLAKCPACRQELEKARRLLSWTEAASEEAVVKLVDDIINGAINVSATNIHLEPQRDNTLLVRYRIDGVLNEAMVVDSISRRGVITRIKMLSDLSVEESRVAQDGRMLWQRSGVDFDIRVSCMPSVYGDSLVMHPLQKAAAILDITEAIGLSAENIEKLERIILQPMGMFFTSGPSGSGKTTVLYSLLLRIVRPELKVMTIEDPVEFVLPGVQQAQVNKSAGFTFGAALRSFLRHDPDVIGLGDIKDLETAKTAVEAAISGHLVLSQLHTNDAVGVIQRLRDMGVDSFLIGASLIGVESQRLLRKVCKECAQPVEIDFDNPVMRYFGITESDIAGRKIYRGAGCQNCRNTGYRGLTGIYEVIEIDRDLREMIGKGASTTEILNRAIEKGLKTLREDAKEKILAGITTPEEAFRVLV